MINMRGLNTNRTLVLLNGRRLANEALGASSVNVDVIPMAAIERVATVELDGETWAFPFKALEKVPVVHQRVAGKEIVVFYRKGTASALDRDTIAEGRDVGSTAVFIPDVDGKKLTFELTDGAFRDKETGSSWNLFGEATEGQLKGKRLEPVVHANHLWFAWAVFKSDTKVYTPPAAG